jgi:hypothetical protein
MTVFLGEYFIIDVGYVIWHHKMLGISFHVRHKTTDFDTIVWSRYLHCEIPNSPECDPIILIELIHIVDEMCFPSSSVLLIIFQ